MTARARDKIRARGLAIEQIRAAKNALLAGVEDLLANRTKRCAPRCPGWRIVHVAFYGFEIAGCYECAKLSGYQDLVTNADFQMLGPAIDALSKASVASSPQPRDHPAPERHTSGASPGSAPRTTRG